MSNPSFSNIDRWLFELNEGNLSPEQVQQLEIFLLQHPELDVDKDMWEMARVEKSEIVYPHQDQLIRRKPVGLFMMAGFVSMAIFIFIGIDLLSSFEGNTQSSVIALAKKDDHSSKNQSALVDQLISEGIVKTEVAIGVEENSNNQARIKRNLVPAGLANAAFRSFTTDYSSRSATSMPDRNTLEIMDLATENHDLIIINSELENDEVNSHITKQESVHSELRTSPLKEIEISLTRNWIGANVQSSGTRSNSLSHSSGFSSQISKATRALTRMMDNPVALKNLRDPNFHLPGMLPLDVNFGNTGTLPATRVQSLTRLQWPEKENQQLTNQLAFDGYIYAIRGGVGVQVNHAYYGRGQIMNSTIAMTYSPKISINRNILLEPAVRFKMGNKTLNTNKINGFGLAEMDRENVQQFYPSGEAPIGQQLWYRDLGLGMMINTKWFFAGIQGDNLFRHYDNIYSGADAASRRVGEHFIATLGTDYESKRELIGLSPYLVYQQNENLKELWMGVNSRIQWFTAGLAVSDQLDGVASVGIKFDRFAFNYQADYTHSSLWNKQLLSHQVSIKFVSLNKIKKQKFINL